MPAIRFPELFSRSKSSRDHRRTQRRSRPTVMLLEERMVLSTLTVQNLNDSGAGSLRDAIAVAQSGDTINFANKLNGTIHLTSGPLNIVTGIDIKGPGTSKLTINGGGLGGEFFIVSPFDDPVPAPITVSISGVTISGSDAFNPGILNFGAALTLKSVAVTANQGGGLVNYGTTTLVSSTVSGNTAGSSDFGIGLGGGILNYATLTVTNSTISNNTALGDLASGGGILSSFGSVLTVSNSTFQGNAAKGVGGGGSGGAIQVDAGAVVTIDNTVFSNNVVSASTYYAQGGAINLSDGATAAVTNSIFLNNQAVDVVDDYIGGAGQGGAISNGGQLTVSKSTFSGNQAVGGIAGFASGGAIYCVGFNATLDLSNATLLNNRALAGPGNGIASGGEGSGGALALSYTGETTVSNTTFLGNLARGGAATGAGYSAGIALGGAVQNLASPLTISNSIVTGNQAVGGAGSKSAIGGDGYGGGVETEFGGTTTISGGLIAANIVQGGAGGGYGFGGGVYSYVSTTTLIDAVITLNFAFGGSGGGKGIGGGVFSMGGPISFLGKTKIILNGASTMNNDLYTS